MMAERAVLLVEQDDGDAALFTELLGAAEPTWRWERVSTLAAARQRLDADTYACVLADLGPPDGDGREVLDQLGEMAGTGVPIIALTESDDEGLAVEAMQRAVQDYLLKTEFDPAHVVRSIRYAIERTEVHQQIQRRERRYSALAAVLTEGILVQDTEGRIIEANAAAARILDIPLSELVTDPPRPGRYRAVSADGTPFPQGRGPGRMALETNEPQIDVVLGIPRRDGATVWLEVNAVPVREATTRPGDDAPDNVVVSFRDITARIRRAREDEQRQRALDEARELAEHRESDRQAAERANEAKNDFLSRLSHELRTPLNAVLGFAQLLQREDLSEHARDYSNHIQRAGTHLLDLINEVLDISRIEAGVIPLSIEPVLIADVVTVAADLSRPLAASRDIVITVHPHDELLTVLADRQRLLQVLLNLLNNATKYNAPNGRVDIHVSQPDRQTIRISVSDTGPGIRPEDLDRLFTPFDRLGAERTDVEGAGVGLALSQSLSTAIGGALSAESTVGQGSTFHCDLPAATVDEYVSAHRETVDRSEPRRTRRVLYIEDNLLSRHLVQSALESGGEVEMIFAVQGRLGIELASHHRPDVILVDLDLPDMHGADVVRELQNDPATRDIPIVVLSADATPSQRALLKRLGARYYLTKPFDLDELDAVIDELAVPTHPS